MVFVTRLKPRPQTYPKPGFLNRSTQPHLGSTEWFSGGHEQRPLLNISAVMLQSPIDEQGTTSVKSRWRGTTNHEKLQTTAQAINVDLKFSS